MLPARGILSVVKATESRFLFYPPMQLRELLAGTPLVIDSARAKAGKTSRAEAAMGQLLSHYSTQYRIYSYAVGEWEYGFAYALAEYDPAWDLGATFSVRFLKTEKHVHVASAPITSAVYLGKLAS